MQFLLMIKGSVGWACVAHLSFCFEETYYIGASHQISVHLPKQFLRRFLAIDQPKTIIAYGSHVCKQIRTKLAVFIEHLPSMIPTTFRFIWLSSFREEDFLEIDELEKRFACGGLLWIRRKWTITIDDLP